ncbi:DUF2065 domain-containing protein [Fundidesulfovibrio magnetotacticus]|nr:DUF2065 domain-containing protein [Fundidesulfovibrio magnetotacticus]
MNIDWKLLLLAVGLALVFEGMPYFLFAEKMPGVLRQLSAMKPRSLRFMGMTAMAVGLFLVWFMTRHAVLP